jgi:glycosyltransferase involved in cell wall biosynthesis
MYLINPSNKIVEVSDEAMIKDLLVTTGFREATDEEIKEFHKAQDLDETQRKELAKKLEEIEIEKKKNPLTDGIHLRTVTAYPDGYGQSHQVLLQSLLDAGLDVSLKYKNQLIGMLYSYPHGLAEMTMPIKIAYTMFESTKIPDEWSKYLKLADKIIVPSTFCQTAFKRAGFDSEVVPLGYDHNAFTYQEKVRSGGEPFTFLHYDAFNTRKGWDILFRAFNEEFTEKDNVKLILKTIKTDLPFPIMKSQYPNIDVIKESYPKTKLVELIANSDCFVFPSRGEGFGLTPLENLAVGTPSIIPNGSGMAEYFNKKYFLEVKIKELRPAMYENFTSSDTGEMIEVDVDDLKKVMRYAYENRDKLVKMGRDGAKWVRKHYSIEQTASKLSTIFEDLKKNAPKPKKLVKIDDKKKECPKLSIVILNNNEKKDLEKCISKIRQNTIKDYELIVVDNGSTDGSIEWLQEQTDINLLINKENVGIPIARNQGMRVAKGEYIVIMDNDLFVEKEWDMTLTGTLENMDRAGIVGINGTNVTNYNPIHFEKPKQLDKITECDVVPGCLQIFRRVMLEKVGYLDEDMPNPKFWHEDLGFCRRIRLSGLKVYTINEFPCFHKGGESHIKTPEPPFGFLENAVYIEHKYRDDNILYIHRDMHDEDCSESFCVLARNISNIMRKLGFVVIRKDSVFGVNHEPITFSFCKAFDMKFNGKKFILLHLENDRPPRNWLKPMESVDYAFNVSSHPFNECTKWGFDANKMIDISPNGVNTEVFNTKVKALNIYPDRFKFLTVGASQPRKGTDVLIKAYFEEFTGDDNTVLIIKDYMYGWSDWTKNLILTEQQKHKNPPMVEHIFEDYPIEKLAQLYRAVAINGAYFHPHKGECFGLPIMEALASGCRVGTTNYTGPKYNLKTLAEKYPNHVHLFDYTLQPSTFHNWEKEPYYEKDEDPQWAEANLGDCKRWARSVYQDRYNARTGSEVAKYIKDNFDWKVTVKKFAEGLIEYGTKRI